MGTQLFELIGRLYPICRSITLQTRRTLDQALA